MLGFPQRAKTKIIGDKAEERACQFLQAKGLRLIEKNYRCRLGEIDLIMQDNEHLLFIEVRYRKNTRFGTAAESITRTKQVKIIKAAQQYLSEKNLSQACRFDVVSFSGPHADSDEPEWIKNAFSVN